MQVVIFVTSSELKVRGIIKWTDSILCYAHTLTGYTNFAGPM